MADQSKIDFKVPNKSPYLTSEEEAKMRKKVAMQILEAGATTGKRLSTDIDAPEQQYDYRSAWLQGASPVPSSDPSQNMHWPSQFKMAGHPNRVIKGIDTITGKPVKK